ncbi:MAG: exosortase C-terminal domain/associated protein EpsI [Burkholderiales bacterium]
MVTVVAVIGVAGAFRAAQIFIDSKVAKDSLDVRTFSATNGWEANPASERAWRPQFGGMAAESQQQFTNGTRSVGLFVAYYRGQQAGAELVNSENVLIPLTDSPWRYTAQGGRAVPWGQESIQARTADIRAGERRLRVRYWYWVDDTWLTSDTQAKMLLARSKLLGRGDDSAAIVIFTELSDPGTEADAALDAFSRDAASDIGAMLRQTRVVGDPRLP